MFTIIGTVHQLQGWIRHQSPSFSEFTLNKWFKDWFTPVLRKIFIKTEKELLCKKENVTVENVLFQGFLLSLCHVPGSLLRCFSSPMGDSVRECDKARGFRTCFTRYGMVWWGNGVVRECDKARGFSTCFIRWQEENRNIVEQQYSLQVQD